MSIFHHVSGYLHVVFPEEDLIDREHLIMTSVWKSFFLGNNEKTKCSTKTENLSYSKAKTFICISQCQFNFNCCVHAKHVFLQMKRNY